MHLTTSPRRGARMLSLAAAAAVVSTALVAAPAAQAATTTAPSVALTQPAAGRASALASVITGSSACSYVATTLSCDLFATTGTSTIAGVAIPTWTFTPTAAAVPTGTGPVIVANQGDTLNLVLHNQLTTGGATPTALGAAAPLSLAVPGMGGGSTDLTGIPADGTSTKTYTFTAGRPGTYLYEAGHTAIGPRAVAMGLVGAIVVRPTGFSALAPIDLDANSPFVDEAVMVLTDVDPKLAAAPLTFDLRNFHSTYRLINGAAFPNTPAIPTTAGNKVLLRYLNAGMISHSMGVLNQRQTIVAIDAQPDGSGALVADTMPAGQTEDAIVTAPEGKTPVYDTSGLLDNGGGLIAGDGTTAGLKRVNFGGMMQLLTTTPVAPLTDLVGPKTTITAASSTSVTASFVDQISPFCTAGGTCGPNNVTAAEYSVDSFGAGGTGTPVTITTPGVTTTQTFPVTVSGSGQHRIYVRAQDAAGNWGLPASVIVTVVLAGPNTTGLTLTPANASVPAGKAAVTITASGDATAASDSIAGMEFFVQAPAAAQPAATVRGTAMTLTGSGAIVPGSATFTATTQGVYSVLVRSLGTTSNTWGAFTTATLTVDNTAPAAAGVTAAAVTPNPTDGVVGDPADPTALKVQATLSDTGTVTTPIVAAEGYLPTPPQSAPTAANNGTGFTFRANDGTFDGHTATSSTSELAYGLIPLTQLTQFPDGTYNVWVHGRDAAGNWGAWVAVPFTVNRIPVVSAVAVTGQASSTQYTVTVTGTSSSPLTTAAYLVQTAAPAAGATGTPCPTAGQSGAVILTCTVTTTLPTGNLTVWVRIATAAGTSTWVPGTLANLLLADNLGALPGPWTNSGATVGTAPTAATAGNAGAIGNMTNPALNVSSTTAYVTSPVINPAARTFFSGFQFMGGTLVTGAGNWVTIGSLNLSAGTPVQVQYQRTTATATTGTLRLVVNGTPNATTIAVPAVTTGVSPIGARPALVRIQAVNGTVSVTVTRYTGPTGAGTTSGGAITSAANAIPAGVGIVSSTVGNSGGTATSGAGFIDNYRSNRFTAPTVP